MIRRLDYVVELNTEWPDYPADLGEYMKVLF